MATVFLSGDNGQGVDRDDRASEQSFGVRTLGKSDLGKKGSEGTCPLDRTAISPIQEDLRREDAALLRDKSASGLVRLVLHSRMTKRGFAGTRIVERDRGRLSTELWRPRPVEISHRPSGKPDSSDGGSQIAGDPTNVSSTTRGRTK